MTTERDSASQTTSAAQVSEPVRYDLPPERLRHRESGRSRADRLRQAVASAWESAVSEHADRLIDPFPAVNPVRGDVRPVVGKRVLLGPLSTADWISEAGRSFLVAGDEVRGFYFLDERSIGGQRMRSAVERFRRRIWKELPEQYTLLAKITGDPELRVVGPKARFGLRIELIAARVGDCLFVQTDGEGSDMTPFLGETELGDELPVSPLRGASPADVLTCAVNALHVDDAAAFQKLFAESYVEFSAAGLPRYRFYRGPELPSAASEWSTIRALLQGELYDIVTKGCGQVLQVMTGKELGEQYPLPAVDHVFVDVDYVGKFGDEYRAFSHPSLRAQWLLQRENGGPWRIVPPNPAPKPEKTELESLLGDLS